MNLRKYREFIFELFDVHWMDSGYVWWVSVAEIQIIDWNGSLFHIEYDMGRWKFEIFWLRSLVLNIIGKWREG